MLNEKQLLGGSNTHTHAAQQPVVQQNNFLGNYVDQKQNLQFAQNFDHPKTTNHARGASLDSTNRNLVMGRHTNMMMTKSQNAKQEVLNFTQGADLKGQT